MLISLFQSCPGQNLIYFYSLSVILFDLGACLSQPLCSFSETAPLLAPATVLHLLPIPSRILKGNKMHFQIQCIFKLLVARAEFTILAT